VELLSERGTVQQRDQVGSLRRLVASPVPPFDLASGPGDSVPAVLEARAARIGDATDLRRPESQPAGKILVFDWADSLSDGAAEQETEGFFDADNAPPYDSWVGLIQRPDDQHPVLLSWIPEALFEQTERAIWVNPEECLRWLEVDDRELAAALEAGPDGPTTTETPRAQGLFDKFRGRERRDSNPRPPA
jgi:hypothetical protein